ncbi:MAG: glutaredoxin family protein [Calothrix sp. SM1_7_51]|nr:glutaredoxin family protein [Calothrix sp. SM1_7_51]
MLLVLYSKPGCHLCEGLQEKLEEIIENRSFPLLQLEIRDITTREDWFLAYQFEIPVLFVANGEGVESDSQIPRPSPRLTVLQLEQFLQKYI